MSASIIGKRIVELRNLGYGRWVARERQWWKPEPMITETLTSDELVEYRNLLALLERTLKSKRT